MNDATTINAFSHAGLTINQAGYDNEILAFKSSDIAHGITDVLETDTYGQINKQNSTEGGVCLQGGTETYVGVSLAGFVTSEDTARSTSALGGIQIRTHVKSGTGNADPGSNKNVLSINGVSGHTKFLVDTDGDVHYDGSTNATAWDDYDDVELLDTLRSLTVTDKDAAKNIFGDFIEDHAKVLNDTGVITLNEDGHHFVSTKGLNGLLIDSIRQTNARMKTIVNAVEEMVPGFSDKLNERLEAQSLPALPA